VTIRSGTHTIHAEQCQFGNDNTYYLNFLFEPAVDLGLSQQTSRITYEDAADKLRDLPDYFKMSYSIDGYIKTIEIGPDPALELGKWYPLPDPPLQENAEVMVTVVSYTGPGPGPVGGILIPVDKFGLLAPYIGLTSTILVATVATAVYVKRVKRKKEKQ
jgi:hypothetical protein